MEIKIRLKNDNNVNKLLNIIVLNRLFGKQFQMFYEQEVI